MKLKSFVEFFKLMSQNYRWKVGFIVIFGAISSFFQGFGIILLVPIIERFQKKEISTGDSWINQIIPIQDFSINQIILIYFIVLIGVSVFKVLQTLYTQRTIANFSNLYSIQSIQTILGAKWDFYLQYPSSKLINLMNTEARSIRNLTYFTLNLIKNSVLLLVQLTFALLVSTKLTLLIVFILSIIIVTQRFFFKQTFQIGKNRINMTEEMQKYLKETFVGIKEWKLHGLENMRKTDYSNRIKNIEKNELDKAKNEAMAELMYTITGAIALIFIVYFSLNHQWISIASLLVLIVLFSRMVNLTNAVIKHISHINNMLPSFVHFQKVLKVAQQSQGNPIPTFTPQKINYLQLKNINYSIQNNVILQNVNLEFEKGKFYILTGSSGIGKTITFDLISGLISPQSGEIIINQQQLSTEEIKQYQASINYVQQQSVVLGMTIRENINFFSTPSEDNLQKATQLAGLEKLIEKLPNGLDTEVNEDNRNFSGGEIQRITIARALVNPPSVLILDEVTNSLDKENENLIMESLQTIKQNSIVIMITHKEYLFDCADIIYTLK
jgi:ABC-type multidrug transport system fused ATPase/permease subunit